MSRSFTIYNADSSPVMSLGCDVIESGLVKELLTNAEIDVIGQLSNSSNAALLGSINTQDSHEISVVIKPAMYENPLHDFEWGTLARREVAAFKLSELLGWNIVPETVLRDVNDMECSVQLFIPHDPRQHYFTLGPVRQKDMEVFAVFDYLINNADRKAGHILSEVTESFEFHPDKPEKDNAISTNSKLWGIDHGVTFHVEDKLRTVIWDFAEQQISDKYMNDLVLVLPKIEKVLVDYLSLHEIEKTIGRAEMLLANPFHRALDTDQRSFPWPLV